MKPPEDDIGKLLLVRFWDHAQGDTRAYSEAVGWLASISDAEIVLRHWRTPSRLDLDDADADDAILCVTIIGTQRL